MEWIDLYDKLPDSEQLVLVYIKSKESYIAMGKLSSSFKCDDCDDYCSKDRWENWYIYSPNEDNNDNEVTHWMELPKRPEEEIPFVWKRTWITKEECLVKGPDND